jgi:DNA modification methylase
MHKYNLVPKLDLALLATFIPNKKAPIYNWFYYKEGYSRELVMAMIERFDIGKGKVVLDPFSGSGTTLLSCKERGIDAIGLDTLPASVLASKVKTRDYNIQKLEEAVTKLLAHRYQKGLHVSVPDFVRRYFSKYALEDIYFFRGHILDNDDLAVRDFLLLGLINAAMRVSFAYKDGAVLKIRKHPTPPFRKMLSKTYRRMLKDLEKFPRVWPNITVHQDDARRMGDLPDESIDAVITSPPYLNNIDYQKVYSIENWLASGELAPAVRSFIGGAGAEGDEFLHGRGFPPAAQEYFKDMNEVLKELYRVCKKGAQLAIVVGNAYFPPPYSPVESDVVLTELAEKAGFSVGDIWVVNQRAALKDRTKIVGQLRESIIFLEK